MKTLEERHREAKFVDVEIPVSGWDDGGSTTLYRFPNDETGHSRAVRYRNAYNLSLREAMGVAEADLELGHPEFGNPGEYDRALKAERYRDHRAILAYPQELRFVGNDDPMPTDYPHNF